MKKVIQKRIVKVIQPEIVEYYCDRCNKKFKKGETKKTWYTPNGKEHYCIECNKLK